MGALQREGSVQDSEKCWFCGKSAPFLGRCGVVQRSLEGCRESGEAKRSGLSYRKGVEVAFHKRVDDVEAFIYNEDFRGHWAGEKSEGRVHKDTQSSTGGAGQVDGGLPRKPRIVSGGRNDGAKAHRRNEGPEVAAVPVPAEAERRRGLFPVSGWWQNSHASPSPAGSRDPSSHLLSVSPLSRILSLSPSLATPLCLQHTQAVPPVTILLLSCLSLANVSISAFSLCLYVPTNALATVRLLPSPVY